jgi:hypothetical protein
VGLGALSLDTYDANHGRSFVEHARQRHERRTHPLPYLFLLWDDVHHHGAAQRARVSTGLASAIRAGWTDAVAFGVGPDWG